MSKAVIASGTTVRIDHELRSRFRHVNASAIGVASAFVSERGVEEITSLASAARIRQKCLIAGTDYFITHPAALFRARKDGWKVRLGSRSNHGGIFHPKLIVAGRSFDSTGVLRGLSFSYLGSANITRGGLERNVEDGFIATGADCVAGSAEAFAEFWGTATPATADILNEYASEFERRNRRRSTEELEALGVSDGRAAALPPGAELRRIPPPRNPALPARFATAVWAGLQSFTGEWRFQIEFPKAAGLVVRRLVGGRSTGGRLRVLCKNDDRVRRMLYDFYPDNSMFRLNVPNDVPGVDVARVQRSGLALVERDQNVDLQLTLIPSGGTADEVMARSYALGTWGRTTTRLYGWY